MSRRSRRYTLREARDYKGLSREKVAAELGVSSKTIERMEQANRAKRYLVEQLAVLYGVDIDRIVFDPWERAA